MVVIGGMVVEMVCDYNDDSKYTSAPPSHAVPSELRRRDMLGLILTFPATRDIHSGIRRATKSNTPASIKIYIICCTMCA